MPRVNKETRKDGITSPRTLEEEFKFDEMTESIIDAGTNGGDCECRAFAVALAQVKSAEESFNTEGLNKNVRKLTHKVSEYYSEDRSWREDWALRRGRQYDPAGKTAEEWLECVKRDKRWVCHWVANLHKVNIVVFKQIFGCSKAEMNGR